MADVNPIVTGQIGGSDPTATVVPSTPPTLPVCSLNPDQLQYDQLVSQGSEGGDRPPVPPAVSYFDPALVTSMDSISATIDASNRSGGPGWQRTNVPPEVVEAEVARLRQEAELLDGIEGKEREVQRLISEANRFEALNARDGVPGAMLDIELNGREAIIVGDLHGNEVGLERILNSRDASGSTLLERLTSNRAVLIFAGDAIHPSTDPLGETDSSIRTLDQIVRLQAQYPDQVFYTQGNHDIVYGAGEEIFLKGGVFQGPLFRDALVEQRRLAYARSVQEYFDSSPLIVRVRQGGEVVAIAGHSPVVRGGLSPEQAVAARIGYSPGNFNHPAGQLSWNRPGEGYTEADVARMRTSIGSEGTVFISGHTPGDTSAWQPGPGQVILQASVDFDGNLSVVRVGPDSRVEVVNVTGTSALAGIDLRPQVVPSAPRVALSVELPGQVVAVMTDSVFFSNLDFFGSPEFLSFSMRESIGGTAGSNRFGVNVVVDPSTGRMMRCSNAGDANLRLRMTLNGIISDVYIENPQLNSMADSFVRLAVQHNQRAIRAAEGRVIAATNLQRQYPRVYEDLVRSLEESRAIASAQPRIFLTRVVDVTGTTALAEIDLRPQAAPEVPLPVLSPEAQPAAEASLDAENHSVRLNPDEPVRVRVPEHGFELNAGGQTYEVFRWGGRVTISLKTRSPASTRIFDAVGEGETITRGAFELTRLGRNVVEIRYVPSPRVIVAPRPVANYAGLPLTDLLVIDETALGSVTNSGTFEETARSEPRTQTAESAPAAAAQAAYGGAVGGLYAGILHPINEGLQQCVDPTYVPYAVTVADTAAVYGLHTWYSTAGGMSLAESNVAFAEGGPAVAAAATVVGRGVETALETAGIDTTSDAGRTEAAVTTGAGTGAAAAWMWPYLASTGPLGFGVGSVMYVLSDWQNNARSFTEAVDHALDDTNLQWCGDPTRAECIVDTLEVSKDVVVDGATGLYRSAAYVLSGEVLSDGYSWATDQIGYELCIPFYNCD